MMMLMVMRIFRMRILPRRNSTRAVIAVVKENMSIKQTNKQADKKEREGGSGYCTVIRLQLPLARAVETELTCQSNHCLSVHWSIGRLVHQSLRPIC